MAARMLYRLNSVTRRFFTTASAPKNEQLEKVLAAEAKHAEDTMKTWKMISLFVAVPAVMFCAYNALRKEQEHHTHPRAEFKPYSHLRIRNKMFPWGDGNHSLFHNSHANALPDGYEDGEDGGHEH